jgi:hypothetical protein
MPESGDKRRFLFFLRNSEMRAGMVESGGDVGLQLGGRIQQHDGSSIAGFANQPYARFALMTKA